MENETQFEEQFDEEISEGEEIDQMAELEEAKSKTQFKLFGIFDVSNIKVEDPGMRRYINLDAKLLVKSSGKHREKFAKGKINLIEAFANLIAVPGHRGKKHKIQTNWASGKYNHNMKIVIDCLKIVEKKTGKNPVQVFVTAIERGAPRDGVTVIEYGGARYPQAVDMSPLKRVSITLRYLVQGSYDKSFNKKTRIEEALADEIIKAYNKESDSYVIQKKNDSEKQADSAR